MLNKILCWLGFHDFGKEVGYLKGKPFPEVTGAPVCKHCGEIEYFL